MKSIPSSYDPIDAWPRPVPRGFLPFMAAWGLSPALLLVMALLLTRIGGPGSSVRALGALLGQVSFFATPVILFAWSAFLLCRGRGLRWWLAVPPLALLLGAANAALTFGAFALIEVVR